MQEQYRRWYSRHLGFDLDMLVFGHSGYPVILFPTSMGRYYQNKDFGLIESAKWFLEQGLIKIYCPDGIDNLSWYNKGVHPAKRAQNHIWYDKMLHDELVPWAQQETGHSKVVTAGCSFGGYHAANYAFKHPERVSHMFSMAGAFDIRGQVSSFYNDDIYYNNPVDYLVNDANPDLWKMKIILGTSDGDICKEANFRLSEILNRKGINHWLDVRHGNHDWPVWRDMFPHYLSLI